MDQIDFPDKYENLMRIAQQALADQRYTQAKELLLRAHDLEPNFEVNSLLVFCLFELDEKQEALSQAVLHESEYLASEEFAGFYFDLLIANNDFLYVRKLIASCTFPEEFEQSIINKVQQAEQFSSQMERQNIREIHRLAELLPTMEPAEQLLMIQKIEELPYHEFVQVVTKLIIMPEVQLLARAKMLESLTRVKECHPISYLTIDETLVQFIPKLLPMPENQPAYQELRRLAEEFENQDAFLSTVLKEEFAMQSALVYPIYDTYINDPNSWFDLTVAVYRNDLPADYTEVEIAEFMNKRAGILKEMMILQEGIRY